MNPNAALRKDVPLVYDRKKTMDIRAPPQTKAWFDVNPTPDVIADLDIGKRIQALLAACNGMYIVVNGKAIPAAGAKALLRSVAAAVGGTFDGTVAGNGG